MQTSLWVEKNMKNMYYERQYHQENLSEDNSRFVLSIFEVINGQILT